MRFPRRLGRCASETIVTILIQKSLLNLTRYAVCVPSHVHRPCRVARHFLHHQRQEAKQSGWERISPYCEKGHFRQRTSEEIASAISELRSKGTADTSDDPFAADGSGVAAVDSWQSFSVWLC